MREIKFRAWDKMEKRMARKIVDLRFNSKGLYAVIVDHMGFDFKRRANDVELMQYTGLKDRNGKEIFEGDIVNCSRGCPHEVYFEDEYGGTYVGGMPAFYLKGLLTGYAWTGSEEIIGNIHENPELLGVRE